MQLALHSQLVKRNGRLSNCLYICTEDVFPSQRLLQLEQSIKHHNPLLTNHRFSDHVFVEHISNKDQLLAALENKVPKLLARGLTNLIIIDSITAVFRGQDEQQTISARSKDISAIGVQLHRLATEYHVAVSVSTRCLIVMADMTGSGESRNLPALGLTWSNLVTTRLKVRRSHQDSIRQLVVAFAPHLHNNYCEYLITEHGVVSPG
ncbi:XRCC3 [Bugula neritina]|uniref:XRCC3 n=1 Tax=Bugula neritina TaxID=10212 RepID=A0A7J7JBI1_BUGNE|nr:XRCC3 [Bugula neritina]